MWHGNRGKSGNVEGCMGRNQTTSTHSSTANSQQRHKRWSKAGALLLVGGLVVAACGGDDDAATAAPAPANAPAADPAPEGSADLAGSDFVQTSPEPPLSGDGGFDIGVVGRDVIIEMGVVVSSDNIQRTVASIMAKASALGGGVASSNVDYATGSEDPNQGFAVLVVKVPPAGVATFVSGLDDSGTVQSINQSAQDVTEQLIDLEVRISNAAQSVANVRDFMGRTENLNELVTLESELTRRQTELERLEAQQRNLSDRVALSTITVEVVPTASVPVVVDEPAEGIGDAFATGWDAFVAILFALGFILAVLAPFLAVAALIVALGWLFTRSRTTPATRPLDPPELHTDSASLTDSAPVTHDAEPVSATHED